MRFTTDCHVHTRWSACADPIDIRDYLGCAHRLGVEYFAITDHSNDIYFDGEDAQGLKWKLDPPEFYEEIRKRSKRMDEYISYVGQYRDMGVRVGIELEQMPLSGDFIFDWEYRERFDVVIGSVHSVPSIRKGVAADLGRQAQVVGAHGLHGKSAFYFAQAFQAAYLRVKQGCELVPSA